MKKILPLTLLLLISLTCRFTASETPPAPPPSTLTVLADPGGRVAWLFSQDLIAFDKLESDGYYDVYSMAWDGSATTCLTCASALRLHNGDPVWHPSGAYIAFSARDESLGEPPALPATFSSFPGTGVHNNIWVMSADGKQYWQMTRVEKGYGTLHPTFSPDGKKLLWSEIIAPGHTLGGSWALKLADFSIENGEAVIANVQTMTPLSLYFYGSHEFSADGNFITFAGIRDGGNLFDLEIYSINLISGETLQLTNNQAWDEHPHFTPDGKSIIWVSSMTDSQTNEFSGGLPKYEYWMMSADGSNPIRLTGFNDPASPDYLGWEDGAGLADFEIGLDGKTMLVKMKKGKAGEIIATFLLDLPEASQ